LLEGIAVDIHVQRVSLAAHLVPATAKSYEAVRYALEQWVPFFLWDIINESFASLGQWLRDKAKSPAAPRHAETVVETEEFQIGEVVVQRVMVYI
jgi:endonuclease III